MKVERSRTLGTAAVRRDSRGAASGFADSLEVSAAPSAAPVSAASIVGGIDALFAMQTVGDALDDRGAAARGEEILDRLEDLRRGLLLGRIGRDKLGSLAALSSQGARNASDPRLRDLLLEIDLRAQVELAKLQLDDV